MFKHMAWGQFNMAEVNRRITRKRAEALLERHLTEDRPGVCRYCAIEHLNVPAQASDMLCDNCGDYGVCGAEDLIGRLE